MDESVQSEDGTNHTSHPEENKKIPKIVIIPPQSDGEEASSKNGEQPGTYTCDEDSIIKSSERTDSSTDTGNDEEHLKSSQGTPALCKICNSQASMARKKTERNVLACHECGSLVHYHCTRAPPYLLYSYSTTGKRFTCEVM